MLVLSRKLGEQILIDNVKVTVVKLAGNRVALGVEAPDGVRILRSELLDYPANERVGSRQLALLAS
jgi:carbon storage regulator